MIHQRLGTALLMLFCGSDDNATYLLRRVAKSGCRKSLKGGANLM